MTTKVGKLTFESAKNKGNLLAKPVQDKLGLGDFLVAEINPNFSDTTEFCAKYEMSPKQAANCLVIEAVRGNEIKYAACLVPGNTRADLNKRVRKYLNVRRVSLAQRDFVVNSTGMEYGGITIIGLPSDWPILIDKSLLSIPNLIIGSGLRNSKLLVSGQFLEKLPNVTILEGLIIDENNI